MAPAQGWHAQIENVSLFLQLPNERMEVINSKLALSCWYPFLNFITHSLPTPIPLTCLEIRPRILSAWTPKFYISSIDPWGAPTLQRSRRSVSTFPQQSFTRIPDIKSVTNSISCLGIPKSNNFLIYKLRFNLLKAWKTSVNAVTGGLPDLR